MIECNEEN